MATEKIKIVNQIKELIPQLGNYQLPIDKTTRDWAHCFTNEQWENLPSLATSKQLRMYLMDIEKRIQYNQEQGIQPQLQKEPYVFNEEDLDRF